jgi:uncharacterized protein YkwD
MRALELIVVFTILVAIASTFFLYRSHIIKSDTTIFTKTKIAEPSTATIIVSQTDSDTVTTFTPDEQAPEMAQPSGTTTPDIVIEEIPLSKSDTNTISSLIHSLSSLSRSQNNLQPLILDKKLNSLATERSTDMIEQNYFSHTTPDGCDLSCRFVKADYNSMTMGENLATSNTYHLYTPNELAQTFIYDWLKSSEHRDNLLSSKFTHYGIGVAEKNDKIIVTVIFARPQQ